MNLTEIRTSNFTSENVEKSPGYFEKIITDDCKKLFAFKNSDNPSRVLGKHTNFQTGEVKVSRIYQNCVSCNQQKFDNLNERHFFRNNLFCDACYKVKYLPMRNTLEKNRYHPRYEAMAILINKYMQSEECSRETINFPEIVNRLPAPFKMSKL